MMCQRVSLVSLGFSSLASRYVRLYCVHPRRHEVINDLCVDFVNLAEVDDLIEINDVAFTKL